MGQGKSQARLEDLTLRKNHHTPSQARGGGGGGCPGAHAPPEEEMVWECGGHASPLGSGVLHEPHLQHHASSTQRSHAGRGTGGGP